MLATTLPLGVAVYYSRSSQGAEATMPRLLKATGTGLLLAAPTHGMAEEDTVEAIGMHCDSETQRTVFSPAVVVAREDGLQVLGPDDPVPSEVVHGLSHVRERLRAINIELADFSSVGEACSYCHGAPPHFMPIFREYDVWPGMLPSEHTQWIKFPNFDAGDSAQLERHYLSQLQAHLPTLPRLEASVLSEPGDSIDLLSQAVYEPVQLNLAQETLQWRKGFYGDQRHLFDAVWHGFRTLQGFSKSLQSLLTFYPFHFSQHGPFTGVEEAQRQLDHVETARQRETRHALAQLQTQLVEAQWLTPTEPLATRTLEAESSESTASTRSEMAPVYAWFTIANEEGRSLEPLHRLSPTLRGPQP